MAPPGFNILVFSPTTLVGEKLIRMLIRISCVSTITCIIQTPHEKISLEEYAKSKFGETAQKAFSKNRLRFVICEASWDQIDIVLKPSTEGGSSSAASLQPNFDFAFNPNHRVDSASEPSETQKSAQMVSAFQKIVEWVLYSSPSTLLHIFALSAVCMHQDFELDEEGRIDYPATLPTFSGESVLEENEQKLKHCINARCRISFYKLKHESENPVVEFMKDFGRRIRVSKYTLLTPEEVAKVMSVEFVKSSAVGDASTANLLSDENKVSIMYAKDLKVILSQADTILGQLNIFM